jgi:hypothetical protein
MIKMILTKEVEIKINGGNIPYYKKFDIFKNIKKGDTIIVPLSYVPKTNSYKIKVKCDICGKEKEILYSTYWDTTKKETQFYCCKGKCSNLKREQTNMELYGVKNCFQSQEKIEKIKNTMIENYGVEHNMKLQRCLNARVETYRKNYGCDNPTQNHDILKKSFKKGNKINLFKNTDIYYQGSYELDFLEKYYDKLNIKRGPSIEYTFNEKNKIYHSDFYIEKYNLIIEIKSSYWFGKFKDMIDTQKLEVLKKYNYILKIILNLKSLSKICGMIMSYQILWRSF